MAQDKNYNSVPYKRIIDLAKLESAEVADLIRVWRTANGDEKAITLENLLTSLNTLGVKDPNAVHYDTNDGKNSTEQQQARTNINVFSKEEVKAITGELADLTTVDKTNLVVAINLKGQYRAIEW